MGDDVGCARGRAWNVINGSLCGVEIHYKVCIDWLSGGINGSCVLLALAFRFKKILSRAVLSLCLFISLPTNAHSGSKVAGIYGHAGKEINETPKD